MTFIVCLKPMALERCCGYWSTGLHNSAQLVAGLPSHLASGSLIVVRQHFCHLEPPLPLCLFPLTGAQRTVVSSTFLAHSSMTVINTSTDSVLCINNNIPVWLVGWSGGWRGQHDLFSLLPASVVVWLLVSQIFENRTMKVISEVITKELFIQL